MTSSLGLSDFKVASELSFSASDKLRRKSSRLCTKFFQEFCEGSITGISSWTWEEDKHVPSCSFSAAFELRKMVKESLRKRDADKAAALVRMWPQLPQSFSCLNEI